MSKRLFGCLFFSIIALTGCGNEVEVEEEFDLPYEVSSQYKNPFEISDGWDNDYGFGDPYIFRHNGTYYLYVSTYDPKVGIKAWSSRDLVDWNYEGLVTEAPETKGAYAPEVIYWDGSFYMYTSPAGKGHYVLKSETPTGPFEVVTENMGRTIDGSIFVDNDGQWYFYYASEEGIKYEKMSDPTTFGEGEIIDSTYMNGWTEGPAVIQKDGYYYLTYTGNHVISRGYRVNYSSSKTSPFTGYVSGENNPIIINTTGDFYGLGHSSSVLGPDLDSYYIAYHNLIGLNPYPQRKMNIDRLSFNGSKMSVLGPTNFDVPTPPMPEFYGWVDDESSASLFDTETINKSDYVLSNISSEANYTAEYVFSMTESNALRLLFSYQDSNQYGYITIDQGTNELVVGMVKDGNEVEVIRQSIPVSFDYTVSHTIRLQNGNDKIVVYLDNMKLIETEESFEGGKIGYRYVEEQPKLSFTAFSNHVFGSSEFETVKPIPGTVEAIHYVEENNLSQFSNPLNQNCDIRLNKPCNIVENNNKYAVQLKEKNDSVSYYINAKSDGIYGLDIFSIGTDEKVTLEITVDNQKPQKVTLQPQEGLKGEVVKSYLTNLSLSSGYHVISIKVIEGATTLESLSFYEVQESATYKHKLDIVPEDESDWRFVGTWVSGETGMENFNMGEEKSYYGTDMLRNYSLEIDFSIADNNGEAGIYYLVTNESEYEHQVKEAQQGYYLSVKPTGLELYKLNFGKEVLATYETSIDMEKFYHYKIQLKGNKLEVYVDKNKKPVISVEDATPWTHGKVGFNAQDVNIAVKNLRLNELK